MALGPFAFEAFGLGAKTQDRSLDTSWAELQTVARFDALQWMGPKSDEVQISGCIFEEAFGGQASLDGIRNAAIAGRPLMLVTGAGNIHGMHVVFSVSEGREYLRADGLARFNAFDISLRRYTGTGGIGSLAILFT